MQLFLSEPSNCNTRGVTKVKVIRRPFDGVQPQETKDFTFRDLTTIIFLRRIRADSIGAIPIYKGFGL